ncbi:hypothetical protein LYNGBM3L_51140 [Moorena producens 3L]|uniref:Uncharacterized protein n=2 Tax=Coleofasciculaceae TaxID=1892251 RepID=F4XYF9_9CYAN|nr:hypothetical protein LYNGBM3L_51140 [Moorena producens 3L]OLT67616.1 hypothetical protein BI334_23600 [Moorena producens 3L]
MSIQNQKNSKKKMRGVPVYYDELKKPHTIMFTDSVWKWLQLSAKDSNTSVGEFIERWARSQIEDTTG